MNRNDRKLVLSPVAKRWRIGFVNDHGQWEDGNGATICKVGEELATAPLPDARLHLKLDRLAVDFTRTLKRWLPLRDLREVRRRNKAETEANICHSHDFCDANMAMHEAFIRVFKRNPLDDRGDEGGMSEADTAIWNAAWDLAKRREFR